MSPKTVICNNPLALATAAAQRIVELSSHAIEATGWFTIALSGGSTPKLLYETLASKQFVDEINWSKWQVWFGDERFLPLEAADSNFQLADRALLSKVSLPQNHTFPVDTDVASVEIAAQKYNQQIEQLKTPIDLILCGLGKDDCHTHSLFPGKDALKESHAKVTWSSPGIMPPKVDRITFTLQFINTARQCMFLVSGADKANAVAAVLNNPPSESRPASLIQPHSGELVWFLDQPAASGIV